MNNRAAIDALVMLFLFEFIFTATWLVCPYATLVLLLGLLIDCCFCCKGA